MISLREIKNKERDKNVRSRNTRINQRNGSSCFKRIQGRRSKIGRIEKSSKDARFRQINTVWELREFVCDVLLNDVCGKCKFLEDKDIFDFREKKCELNNCNLLDVEKGLSPEVIELFKLAKSNPNEFDDDRVDYFLGIIKKDIDHMCVGVGEFYRNKMYGHEMFSLDFALRIKEGIPCYIRKIPPRPEIKKKPWWNIFKPKQRKE